MRQSRGWFGVLLLAASLLVGCADVSADVTEERVEQKTYALEGELFGEGLAGTLDLEFVDVAEVDEMRSDLSPAYGPDEDDAEKLINGSLTLRDGVARRVFGSLNGDDIILTFFMRDQLIEGSGKTSGAGNYNGSFLSGEEAQRVEGSWQATLQEASTSAPSEEATTRDE